MSVVGLGTNNFGFGMAADAVAPVVHAALEAGITLFDTADSYLDSEERLGQALGGRRDEVIVATKFGSPLGEARPGGAAPAYVRSAVERSLQKLGTDRIDLYQLHRPDPLTPIADTLGALSELVSEGKVREIGCSNFSVAQLRDAESAASSGSVHFVSVQNQLNLLHRDDLADVIPECRRLNAGYLPYFPLASGLLTGKYRRDEPPAPGTRLERWGERASGALTDQNFDVLDRLSAWSVDHGRSVLDLAFAWLIAIDVVSSVIAGATSPEQVRANVLAGEWRLTDDDVRDVNALLTESA